MLSSRLLKMLLLVSIPAAVLLAGILIYFFFYQDTTQVDTWVVHSRNFETREITYQWSLFNRAIEKYPNEHLTAEAKHNIVAGILPHHDLASDLIAEFFYKLKKEQQPKKFIIIGPNHPDEGEKITSAYIAWKTPFGTVKPATSVLALFEKEKIVVMDNSRLVKEHAITTIIPFISYYFPDAEVAAFIMTSKNNVSDTADFAKKLSSLIDEDTVVLGSIDFSHYLPSRETVKKDAVTQQLLNARDYQAISKLNSDYIDSPPSLIAILELTRLQKAENSEIIRHLNSADIVGRDLESSTSYFTIFFRR